MNLNEWTAKYLEIYKSPFLKRSTMERYKTCLAHVPAIDLATLTTLELQSIINKMIYDGLSVSSIRQTKIIISQALERAKRLGYSVGADFSGVDMPRGKKNVVRAFDTDEQLTLIRNLHRSYYGDFFLALLVTGARVGELIALDWANVNLRARRFRIASTAYVRDITAPKTAESLRFLPINDEFFDILTRHFSTNGRVFRNTLGEPIIYRSLLDAWHRLLDLAGLPSVGLHVLRHTYATNALRAGVDVKVLSKMLGHASVSITLDIYCDVSDNDKKTAAGRISDFFAEMLTKNAQNTKKTALSDCF